MSPDIENNFGKIENNVYKETFIPYTYNCDRHAKVNVDWIFEVAQEVAASHSSLLNCSIYDLNEIGLTWVISRENIEINDYPKWREKVFVETWAEKPYRRVLIPRIIQGKNEKGELLFRSSTLWAIIDLKTNRPIEPSKILEQIGIPKHSLENVFSIGKRDIIENDLPIISKVKPNINYSDTDLNKHVNNISYVRWTLRSMPSSFRDNYVIKNIDVSWLKQTYLHNSVEVITSSEDEKALEKDNSTFFHKLVRSEETGNKTVVFESKTIWKENS